MVVSGVRCFPGLYLVLVFACPVHTREINYECYNRGSEYCEVQVGGAGIYACGDAGESPALAAEVTALTDCEREVLDYRR